MENLNKNGIPFVSEKDLEQMVDDQEDQDKQEGFSQSNIVIEMCQLEARIIGKLGHSGRA